MQHHLSLRRKIIIMVSTMASLFLVALDQTIVSTALGKIVEEFHAFDALGWVVTAYLITTTITVPIAGKLSDLFGRRVILLSGVAIFTIASLLSGLSGSIGELIAWRAVQGIGGGIITANAFTIVADLFAARERGRWQGMIGAVFGLSSLVGPLLGGWLTDGQPVFGATTDWRWTFFINVPVGIVAFILIRLFSPSLRHAAKPVIDYLGAAVLALVLATLILAVDNTETIFAGLLEATGISLVTLRIIMGSIVALGIVAFLWIESRSKEPIVSLALFKNRNFSLILVAMTLFGASFMGSILYLTQFNQQVFGATPTDSGLMLLPMVGGMMVASITVGQIISRTGRYKAFVVTGFVVATLCMFLLTTLTPESTYTYEAVIIGILGLGMGVAMPVLSLAVQNEFEQRQLGAVTSSTQLFRSLGSTIGVGVFGAMLTAGIVTYGGSLQSSAYIQALQSSPAAAQLGDLTTTNTLLMVNTSEVSTGITDAFSQQVASLPEEAKQAAISQFSASQSEFSSQIVHAFSDSIQRIFTISAVVMVFATVAVAAIRERPLRSASPLETPGE